MTTTMHRHVSAKASRFTESVIREMTREALKHGAVNLSQGFPDFPAPADIKARAMQAIADDVNQYAITWGARDFRQAIARKTEWYLGLTIDPEMEIIASLCQEHDALCFTDEIYEHILYPREGAEVSHISMAQLEGMRERTVIVNSMSKTYSVTGWRVGYCIAPPEITNAIRKVHDFLTVGAAAPLQTAGAYALSLPQEYYDKLQADYVARRDLLLPALEAAGFRTFRPDGAYYIMTDISGFGFKTDVEFTRHLIRDICVACVPGSSFYSRPELGAQQVRFCFCKRDETLLAAAERLRKLR